MTGPDCYRPGRDGSAETPVPHTQSQGDAWHAFGALAAGVFVYGMIGWALDRWWDTSFLVVVGILVGAGLGIFMTWRRFAPPADQSADVQNQETP